MSRFRRLPLILAGSIAFIAPAMAQGLKLGLGRPALPQEIAAWAIAVRPDGQGLPKGEGTSQQGEAIYTAQCASCHGDFGQGVGRWPAVAGGKGTLTAARPEKTIGSFWPDAPTIFDYVRRTMPFGKGQTLTAEETYAVTAYLLFLNDIVTEETFELNERTLAGIKLPNAGGFRDDDRETSERAFWGRTPCMTDCKTGVTVTARAPPEVTPGGAGGQKPDQN